MRYNRRKEFTPEEAEDIENLIYTLNELDPEHKHNKLLKGFNIGEDKNNIIEFPGVKDGIERPD